MERILSQQEIDELIHDLSAESTRAGGPSSALVAESAEQVAPYDFRRPSKFSRDQLRSLERIHQQFGRLLGIRLGARLRTDLSAPVMSLQQLTYGEFIRSVPNPSVLAVVSFGGAGDRMILQLSLDLAYDIYERLAGGPGSAKVSNREPTEIELQVLRRQVLENMAEAYRQAWASFLPLETQLLDIETNPVYVNLALDQDTVLWIALNLTISGESDALNLCLPYSALEPLLPHLSNEYLLRAQGQSHERDRQRLQAQLRDTLVPLQAVLGTADLELGELMDLKVGDVVMLDTGIHDEVQLRVGNLPKFKGRVGRKGSQLAVSLTGPAVAAHPEDEAGDDGPPSADAGSPKEVPSRATG